MGDGSPGTATKTQLKAAIAFALAKFPTHALVYQSALPDISSASRANWDQLKEGHTGGGVTNHHHQPPTYFYLHIYCLK